MQMLFDAETVSSNLPMDQPLIVFVNEMWQKRLGPVCIYRWKSYIVSCLELNPGIMMLLLQVADIKHHYTSLFRWVSARNT